MTLSRYRSSRSRFTWRGCRANRSAPQTSPMVLSVSKDQGHEGVCMYFGICASLEAHQRLKTGKPCGNLCWRDLRSKEEALTNVPDGMSHVSRTFMAVQRDGVCYEDLEEKKLGPVKIDHFEKINMKIPHQVADGIQKYLKVGPMVGIFKIYEDALHRYGESAATDEVYFVHKTNGAMVTHLVAITGFGVQAMYPLWEFQNSHGPKWRGAARGFGQIYALHLSYLYGFRLA